ncbi:MAG: DHHA1 domain-containing protein [Sulfolobales archaeon]|nr:DHHA1 domain-containing protein [Sulfolobales archaeon]MDW8083217.1 DHHA1 domain-containing protein [Sulfolobales archaeon]
MIAHTDLDGVASAAIITRTLGSVDKYVFIQPQALPRVLSSVECSNDCEIYICDLSPNSEGVNSITKNLRKLASSGAKIWWFDHHIWDSSWVKEVLDSGVKLVQDTSTCSAGLVYGELGVGDSVSERLSRATCSLDLWVFDDWLGNFLARYVGYSKSENWRRRVTAKLSSGSLLDSEILEVVEDSISRELEILSEALRKCGISDLCGIRVAYYYKSVRDHVTSYIAALLMARFNADMAAICRRGSVSLRSRGRVDVREIAKKLGGGGHRNAAGFSVRPPWIYRILILLGISSPYVRWCLSRIKSAVCE